MSDTPRAKLGAKHLRPLDKTRAPVRPGALRRPTKAIPTHLLDAGGGMKAPARKRPTGDNTSATPAAKRPYDARATGTGTGGTRTPRDAKSGTSFEGRPKRFEDRGEARNTGGRPHPADGRQRFGDHNDSRRGDAPARPQRERIAGPKRTANNEAFRAGTTPSSRREDDRTPRRAGDDTHTGTARPARLNDDRMPRRTDENARSGTARPVRRDDDRAPRRTAGDDVRNRARPPRRDDDRTPRRGASDEARTSAWRDNPPPQRRADDNFRTNAARPPRRDDDRREGGFARPVKRDAGFGKPKRATRAPAPGERALSRRPSSAGRLNEAAKVHVDAEGTLRLSKRMSELGLCSRREADEWIAKGWVRVDGKVISELGAKILPDQEITVMQAARNEQAQRVTILMHKPVGYVSGQAEDGYEPAVVLLTRDNHWSEDDAGVRFPPQHVRGLAPAGRLDIDSTGLLVLTQDGRIARQLIGEDSDIEKEYLVRVSFNEHSENVQAHFPTDRLALLRHGLSLDDQPLKPAQVDWQNPEQLRFVLKEGKKRQIRRMCELVGLHVTGLKRVRMGRITLGHLPVGQWRYLRAGEGF